MSIRATYRHLIEAATEIEAAWRACDNETRAFSEIVARKTEGLDLSCFGELADMTEMLEESSVCSLQAPSSFSDLYLKLYDNGRFYIEVLNWWASDINIHDHDFSGMQFQLKGNSLNVEYCFAEEQWSPRLTLGSLSVTKAEIWREGDRSVVRPGTIAAHTVNHLSFPTVSLLIRTHGTAAYGPQRNYFPPFVAGSYGVADIVFRKRVGLLRLLGRGPQQDFQRAFRRVIAAQTPTENLFLMIKLYDILFQEQHTGLLREFMASGTEEAEATVRAVAYHRATDFIINTVKRTEGFTAEQILACSVLGSCFDPESLTKIVEDLTLQGHRIDLAGLMDAAEQHMLSHDRAQFQSILKLFGVEELMAPAAERSPLQPSTRVA